MHLRLNPGKPRSWLRGWAGVLAGGEIQRNGERTEETQYRGGGHNWSSLSHSVPWGLLAQGCLGLRAEDSQGTDGAVVSSVRM